MTSGFGSFVVWGFFWGVGGWAGGVCCGFFFKFSLATEEYLIFTAAICYWKCTLAFNNVMSSTRAGSTQEEERSLSSSLTREHEELQELS